MHKFRHNVNRKPSIRIQKNTKATAKPNLNDKLKVSNAVSKIRVHPRMRALIGYALTLHRSVS